MPALCGCFVFFFYFASRSDVVFDQMFAIKMPIFHKYTDTYDMKVIFFLAASIQLHPKYGPPVNFFLFLL